MTMTAEIVRRDMRSFGSHSSRIDEIEGVIEMVMDDGRITVRRPDGHRDVLVIPLEQVPGFRRELSKNRSTRGHLAVRR